MCFLSNAALEITGNVFPWLGELGSEFALACVEAVGGDLYNRGFERLRYEQRLSSITAIAIASTSTAFFIHLPSTACVSLLAHYCWITMGNSLFLSQSPSDGALRLYFLLTMGNSLFVPQSPSDGALRLSFLSMMGNSLFVSQSQSDGALRLSFLFTMGNYQFVSQSLFDEALCSSFSFFVISVNAWWRRLVCAAVSLWWSSVFVVVSFIY